MTLRDLVSRSLSRLAAYPVALTRPGGCSADASRDRDPVGSSAAYTCPPRPMARWGRRSMCIAIVADAAGSTVAGSCRSSCGRVSVLLHNFVSLTNLLPD